MKYLYFLLVIIAINQKIVAQSKNYAVLVNAEVQATPPRITLKWNYNSSTSTCLVYKKLKTASSWGTPLATLTVNDTTYIDNAVLVNTFYEYKISRNNDAQVGYLAAAIDFQPNSQKGRIIVLIDSSIYDSIKIEVNQWIQDAYDEGWITTPIVVSRTKTAADVKSIVITEYQKFPSESKSLFIIGHIAVPYAGNFKPYPPDGHTEHVVAWPADVYYADMDGEWTDNLIDDTTGAQTRHRNIPGDGKWDQTVLEPYNNPELAVGRVDFFNMPAFTKSEIQLTKDYLKKCHNFKTGVLKPKRRGLIDDNFGGFSGEAFASSGWMNLSSLIGKDNILFCDTVNKADYINTMDTASYLWSYGCGAGGYTSCSGVGNTNNLASKNIQTVFTMLFGSYFGDWDNTNNFLRAALASGTTLTNVWSGRPRWFFHHMGLGENIGYSTLLTQNNTTTGLYRGNTAQNMIHIALLGDPTLKLHYVLPPKNLFGILKDSAHTNLTWSVSGEVVLGYNIYKRKMNQSIYTKINPTIINAAQFDDSCISSPDTFIYQVRAVKLETTPSGTYYNESLGSTDTFYNAINLKPKADFSIANNDPNFSLTSTSTNAKTYQWTYSDTSLIHTSNNTSRTYKKNADEWVLLTVSNGCTSDTQKIMLKITKVPTIPSSLISVVDKLKLEIFPNPFNQSISIQSLVNGEVFIYDIEGKLVLNQRLTNKLTKIDLRTLNSGIYMLEFKSEFGEINRYKIEKMN